MTHRAETVEVKAGQCRVCGCTERKPCALEFVDEDGEAAAVACTWVNAARTLCSNPNCLAEVPPETLELARHGMNDLL